MTRPSLTFRVIGYTSLDEELLKLGNVIISGRYTPETFPQLTADARGNLALFLHEWPETYSYTLSEALRSGFLPLVPDTGAPAERVRALQFGIVYPFPSDAAQILQLIEDILAGRIPRSTENPAPRDFLSGAQAVVQMREALNFPPLPGKSRRKGNLTKSR
jgi:glycosyltransferase involved in cell wall biosynthesis